MSEYPYGPVQPGPPRHEHHQWELRPDHGNARRACGPILCAIHLLTARISAKTGHGKPVPGILVVKQICATPPEAVAAHENGWARRSCSTASLIRPPRQTDIMALSTVHAAAPTSRMSAGGAEVNRGHSDLRALFGNRGRRVWLHREICERGGIGRRARFRF